ncbi:hypothetical protein E2562_037721 [Oryza meyeriana var. granulata]|uniref:Uncharacterized protein n=1 Tax=Oryza meyeriana var. granulata TaxID=110450 RepID=A0A6G1ERA5_9ORYZ|nr:hypothetical protein E2562_030602 [Oryza meyeriana var. granulata]KAF0928078.1 hypothetical protein E2562_037721 [Oryza meyeriana var. granulata]
MLVKGKEDGGCGLAVGLTEWEGGGQADECSLTVIESRKRGKEGETATGPGCYDHFFFYLGSAEQSGEQGRVRRKVGGMVELGGVSSGAAGMERCGKKGALGAGCIGGGGDGVVTLVVFWSNNSPFP